MMDTWQRIEMQERVIELLARALSRGDEALEEKLIRVAKVEALEAMGSQRRRGRQ